MKKEAKITGGKPSSDALQLAICGASLLQIRETLASSGIIGSAADKILSEIEEYFKAIIPSDSDEERGKAYARLNLIYLNSIKIQDYKTALAAQKELNKFLALYDGRDSAGMNAPASAEPKNVIPESVWRAMR